VNPNVIVVTINYRLGNFGFLGSPTLAKDGDGSTGNYGLQDQRLAMQWVQDNIASFGGDPTTVMVFGESAGSGSIADHLIMPKSKGLFSRAVMESGPFVNWIAIDMEIATNMYNQLAVNADCTGTDSQILHCLRSLTTNQLMQFSPKKCVTSCCWAPVIDGVEITAAPEKLAAMGLIQHVPVIVGSNANEGSIFSVLPHSLTEQQYEEAISTDFGSVFGPQILAHYPASNYKSPWWASVMIYTDLSFACPARRSARWLSSNGIPVFLYHWTHVIFETIVFAPYLGAFHGVELPFVFNDPDGTYFGFPFIFTPEEKIFQKKAAAYWSQFAISGNPNVEGLPHWPQYEQATDSNIVLNENIANSTGLKKRLCDFWDTLPY